MKHEAIRAFVMALLAVTEEGADPAGLELRLACGRYIHATAALEEAPTRQEENQMHWRRKEIRSVA